MQLNSRKLTSYLSLPLISLILISCNSGGGSNTPTSSSTPVSYSAFNCPGTNNVSFPGVSGVRGIEGSSNNTVYITGVYVQYGSPHAFLYQGPVLGGGVCNQFNFPSDVNAGRTVTSTSLYGPDNNGVGNVIVVGSYTTLESGSFVQQGLLYQGAADGSTTLGYTTLNPSILSPGEAVINTIGHSTMGGIVVGNYDTALLEGIAFIYNINTQQYYSLDKPDDSASLTAYGIWYNGGTSYTIAGGYSVVDQGGVDAGFITDWDSSTQKLSNFTTLNYNNSPLNLVGTHFEGITTDDAGGYNLAADWQYNGQAGSFPSFAHISRNSAGGFTESSTQWTSFAYYPGASWTSANTVYKNYVLGLFQMGTPTMDYGYVATIPQ